MHALIVVCDVVCVCIYVLMCVVQVSYLCVYLCLRGVGVVFIVCMCHML